MHQAFDCLHGSAETDEIGCEGSRKVPARLRTSSYLIDSRRVQQSGRGGVIATPHPPTFPLFLHQAAIHQDVSNTGQW